MQPLLVLWFRAQGLGMLQVGPTFDGEEASVALIVRLTRLGGGCGGLGAGLPLVRLKLGTLRSIPPKLLALQRDTRDQIPRHQGSDMDRAPRDRHVITLLSL